MPLKDYKQAYYIINLEKAVCTTLEKIEKKGFEKT